MAGSAFAKTTGAQIPIDGGNDRVIWFFFKIKKFFVIEKIISLKNKFYNK